MKKHNKWLSLALATLLAVSCLFTACGAPAASASAAGSTASAPASDAAASGKPAETVELDWYLGATPQDKQEDVFAEINKILVEELNIKVNFHFVDFANYGQQMQMLMTSGEKIDIMYTSNWANDFYSDVSKGAYQEIDMAMIEQYGPNIIKQVPAGAWDAAKVDGKLMAIPNVQVLARWPSVLIQNKYAEKYDFDLSAVKTLADFTPLFENIVKNESGIYPIDVRKNASVLSYYVSNMGLEYFAETNPFGIRIDDANLEVINLYETEEMRSFLDTLRDWYQRGIIRKDAASVTDVTAEKQNGKIAAIFAVNNPDTTVNQAKLMGVQPEELTMVPLSDPYLSTSSVVATMNAINVKSPNVKECIQVLNKFYDADDSRCLNLLSYGIEGQQYKMAGDNTIELIPNTGYYVDSGWEYGCLFNSYKTSPSQPDWRPAGPDINNKATVSPIMGFSFNPETVKNEIAQMAAVMDEFVPSLMTGSVDVEPTLAQLNEKLTQAGADKVRAEIQTQLDTWKAGK